MKEGWSENFSEKSKVKVGVRKNSPGQTLSIL